MILFSWFSNELKTIGGQKLADATFTVKMSKPFTCNFFDKSTTEQYKGICHYSIKVRWDGFFSILKPHYSPIYRVK